jgi:hypothetical protein
MDLLETLFYKNGLSFSPDASGILLFFFLKSQSITFNLAKKTKDIAYSSNRVC